jgi:hypothetical protein
MSTVKLNSLLFLNEHTIGATNKLKEHTLGMGSGGGTGAYTYPPETPQTTDEDPLMKDIKEKELQRRKMLQTQSPPQEISKARGYFRENKKEEKADKFNTKLIRKFVEYVIKELGGLDEPINITLVNRPFYKEHTAGMYDVSSNTIRISVWHRSLADIMRTTAHELSHVKQKEQGEDMTVEGDKLQKLEDQANVFSGRYVRNWGHQHPEIYTITIVS